MGKIVDRGIRKIYSETIKQVISDLHKVITAELEPQKIDCPNCIYDTVNKKSSGVHDSTFVSSTTIFGETITPQPFTRGRCPVCFGEGELTVANTKSIKALVRWNPNEDLEVSPAGLEGKPLVRIKAERKHYDTITQALSFTVDGVKCERIQPVNIRGLGKQEELVVAYLLAVEPGSDVKG